MSVTRGNARSTRQRAVTVAERFWYAVRFSSVGSVDSEVGSPTQMALFEAAGGLRIQ